MEATIRTPEDLGLDWTANAISSRSQAPSCASPTMREDCSSPRLRCYQVDLRALEYVGPYDLNLMCAICHCPFVDPVTLDCEHVFCKRCVSQALWQQARDAWTCPSCRRKIERFSMDSAAKILDRILDDLVVKCPQSSQGCQAELPRCSVQDHVDKYCPYTEVNCALEECHSSIRRKDADSGRCLHFQVECKDCERRVMKMDLETHRTLECEFGRTFCPDCKAQLLNRDLEIHTDRCPNAMLPCTAAVYGCDFLSPRASFDDHVNSCPLVKLMPFLKTQADRIEAHDRTLRHLRYKNSILETSFSMIQDTLDPSADRPNAQPSNVEPSDAAPFDSTTHHLLCLFESLREEVSRVSTAVSDMDAKASMMVINERLRAKEDLAHTNAAIGGMRMQMHWLMSARLQNQQRSAIMRTQSSSESLGVGSSSASVGFGDNSGIPVRRSSDSTRQETKL